MRRGIHTHLIYLACLQLLGVMTVFVFFLPFFLYYTFYSEILKFLCRLWYLRLASWVDIAYMFSYLKKDSYWLTWYDSFQNMFFCSIGILKIITDNFLPHMNHLTLEQTFFSQILPKVQFCGNLHTIEDIKIWS